MITIRADPVRATQHRVEGLPMYTRTRLLMYKSCIGQHDTRGREGYLQAHKRFLYNSRVRPGTAAPNAPSYPRRTVIYTEENTILCLRHTLPKVLTLLRTTQSTQRMYSIEAWAGGHQELAADTQTHERRCKLEREVYDLLSREVR